MSVRFRIHENKQATLAGADYQDLRSIFDAAAIHFYDMLRKLRDKKCLTKNERQELLWVEGQLKVLDTIKQGVDNAISATFPPRSTPTKAQRLAEVKNAKKERELIEGLLN